MPHVHTLIKKSMYGGSLSSCVRKGHGFAGTGYECVDQVRIGQVLSLSIGSGYERCPAIEARKFAWAHSIGDPPLWVVAVSCLGRCWCRPQMPS